MQSATVTMFALCPALCLSLFGCASTTPTAPEPEGLMLSEADEGVTEARVGALERLPEGTFPNATEPERASAEKNADSGARATTPVSSPRQEGRRYGPEGGDWEVTLAGVGNNDDEFDNGGFSVAGSIGYYLSEVVELAVRQTISYADFGNSAWNGSTRAAADFHFDLDTLRPFIGANFGVVYGDTVDETMAAAPELGLKWFVKDETFLLALAEFQFFFDDTDELDEGFENGQFIYTLGFGILF